MKSIFNYAFGDGEIAGIATISGDAGGFSYLTEPLSEGDLLSTIYATLNQEEFPDSEKASLFADAEEQMERLHAEHVARFTGELK